MHMKSRAICVHAQKPTPELPCTRVPPYSPCMKRQTAARSIQALFTDDIHRSVFAHTHTHTHETTTSTNPWSLEVVPLVYGALCQVGCFFNSSSFCVFRRPLKDDQAAQDQSKQRHRWGTGMQLKSTSSKNMIQKNLQRFRQRARRDRKKGVIQ